MKWLQTPSGKLAVYLIMAITGSVVALKDIPADTILHYTWWDWLLLWSGVAMSASATVLAFLNQSLSRQQAEMNGHEP